MAARPAELLAACCGLPTMLGGIEILLMRAIVRLRHGFVAPGPGFDHIPSEYMMLVEELLLPRTQAILAVALSAVLVLFLGRHRLIGWAGTALLMIAWVGLHRSVWVLMAYRVVGPLVPYRPMVPGPAWSVFRASCIDFPQVLLYCLPAVMTYRDSGRATWTWLEWAGLTLAATTLSISIFGDLTGNFLAFPTASFWAYEAVEGLVLLAAILVSGCVVRRLDPAWWGRSQSARIGSRG